MEPINCPECGRQWENTPAVCECGFAFGSPYSASNLPPSAKSAENGKPATSFRTPKTDLDSDPGTVVDLTEGYELQQETPIRGFLLVAVIWMAISVAFTAYEWVSLRSILKDENFVGGLRRLNMEWLLDTMRTIELVNGGIVVGGIVMLFALFVRWRFARALVVAFFVSVGIFAYIDFHWMGELAATQANRFLEIDPNILGPVFLVKLSISVLMIIYFLLSKRAQDVFS